MHVYFQTQANTGYQCVCSEIQCAPCVWVIRSQCSVCACVSLKQISVARMFTINYSIQHIRIKQLKSITSYGSFASYIAESKAEKESYLGSAEGQMGSRLTQ